MVKNQINEETYNSREIQLLEENKSLKQIIRQKDEELKQKDKLLKQKDEKKITFDFKKYKAMIHCIISRWKYKEPLIRSLLFKVMYYSDFDNYEIYKTPISGETYIRKEMIPLPIHFLDAIAELKNEGKIKEPYENYPNFVKYMYFSLIEPETNLISPKEIHVIDNAIDRVPDLLFDEMYHVIPGDLPLRIVKDDHVLNYDLVQYREAEYSVANNDDDS